jgi:hypothetical protein
MNRKVFGGLGVILLAAFGLGAVANGPYYALPSWAQKITCEPGNCPRFVVLANWNSEAVLDRETGLVWERAPGTAPGGPFGEPFTTLPWGQAVEACRQFTVGGRMGWRLPTYEELQSLKDPDTDEHGLPPGHPFENVQTATDPVTNRPAVYWSATRPDPAAGFGSLPDSARIVGFRRITGVGHITLNANWFWCVRGGSGIEPL